MSMTTNADNFFQTDATHAKNARRDAKSTNAFGNPIKLKSKILALISDPSAPFSSVFVAESASKVRRVNLESGVISRTYSGPIAPVTCLAATATTVAAGSWDRAIYQWSIASGAPAGPTLKGHSDFVKAIVYATLDGKSIIVSGGADKKIIVWDAEAGKQLYSLSDASIAMGHIQHLAVDPLQATKESVVVVSAGSDPYIRRWKLAATGGEKLPERFQGADEAKERLAIHEHETGVYRVYFSGDEDADLWTASADGTVKCLSRTRNWTAEDTISHGDHVRAVVVTAEWVVTAGRDEDVKVWDRASGKLAFELYGHFDEVMDLVVVVDSRDLSERVVSVGLDGTVRVWPLKKGELGGLVEEMRKEREGKEEAQEEVEDVGEGLTAEEEAELAALMEDD